MSKEELAFEEAGNSIGGAVASKMFGKRVFKVDGKPILSFQGNCMVFKLTGNAHTEALSLDGASLSDPGASGRVMKEWVQLPYSQVDSWARFAAEAMAYFKA